jgi:ElaB/YqjD/DUF883 family membrane-anchored ribosome-binding protein
MSSPDEGRRRPDTIDTRGTPGTDAPGAVTGSGAHPAPRPEGAPGGAPGRSSDAESLRQEIEDTRAALGDTVEALAGKADVKGQVRHQAEERREQVRRLQDDARERARHAADTARERPAPAGALVAAAGALLGVLLLRRRRKRKRRARREAAGS